MDVKAYLWSLTLVCVASAVVRAASGNNAAKKHIDFLCSLCVICALVIPVIEGFSGVDADTIGELFEADVPEYSEENYVEIYNSYLYEGSVSLAEDSLAEGLADALGVNRADIDVALSTDRSGSSPVVCDAAVTLYQGAYDADPQVISGYVEEQTGVVCRIIYDSVDK